MELHRHGLEVERAIEPALLALADETRPAHRSANDVYFAVSSMHEAHDALLCIAEAGCWRTRTAAGSRRALVQTAGAMRAPLRDLPEACDNTLAIAAAAP
jgi:DNA polymerase-3 subunit alpha